jgi:hypothetical protein
VVTGSGRSYGVGITLQRRSGNPTGAIRYSWSKAEQMFPGVNGGRFAPSPFDRRHELQTRILVEPASGWTLGLLAVVATADPRVAPAELRATYRAVEGAAALADAVDLGGSQSPGFQRLQLSLQRGFDLEGRQVRLSLTLMNGYGLLDPFRWELTGSDDPRKAWVAGVEEIPLFPLYPMFSVSVRF